MADENYNSDLKSRVTQNKIVRELEDLKWRKDIGRVRLKSVRKWNPEVGTETEKLKF